MTVQVLILCHSYMSHHFLCLAQVWVALNSVQSAYYSLDSLCGNEEIAVLKEQRIRMLCQVRAVYWMHFHGCSEITAFSAEAVNSIGT